MTPMIWINFYHFYHQSQSQSHLQLRIVMIIIGVKAIHSNFPNGAAPRGKMRCRLQKTRVTKKDEYESIWKKLCFCRGLIWDISV